MSKSEESAAQPPSYTSPAGGSYPQQYPPQYPPQYPAQGYAAPPPYQQDQSGKAGYSGPGNYQTQYQGVQPGYYGQPGQPVMVQPGTVAMMPIMPNPPETHMLFSVLATLCCCWPIGLFAIIKSMEVSTAISRGDRQQAEISSARAYQLAKYAVIAGVVCSVLCLIFLIVFYSVLFSRIDMDD